MNTDAILTLVTIGSLIFIYQYLMYKFVRFTVANVSAKTMMNLVIIFWAVWFVVGLISFPLAAALPKGSMGQVVAGILVLICGFFAVVGYHYCSALENYRRN